MQPSEENNRWYLLYTSPRAEKKVYKQLITNQFVAFLPLQKKIVQYSDRKKVVDIPLFSSYIFVYTHLGYYYQLLNMQGIVKFVNFQGIPVELKQKQIDLIKLMIANYDEIEAVEDVFESGEKVKIIAGPLQNHVGELVEYKSAKKVIIKLENIGFSLLVQLPNNIIRKLKNEN